MDNPRTHPPKYPPGRREEHDDPTTGYKALKNRVAVVERRQTVLRLTGKDPVGMLNAILTNDVPQDERQGAYATLLNPKGRVLADLRVLKDGEDVLVVTEPEGAEAAGEILGRYAPFSRVAVEETTLAVLGLYGPGAKDLLGEELVGHQTVPVRISGAPPLLAAGVEAPVPGYDLIGPADDLRSARQSLVESGAVPATREADETARVEAGIPRFGPDITPDNFPAEAGILDRAVSFSKGCYPGQETVARMHYRGHPNRALHRLKVEGPLPQPGTPIVQNEKQVGKITSVAPLPVGGEILALGYLHRNTDLRSALKSGGATVTPAPAL